MRPITVLIADSQALFADALAIALEGDPQLAVLLDRPRSGPETVETAEERRPDVALIDYWLAEMGAPEVTDAIRERSPETKVINTSSLHAPSHIRHALSAGAVGFLPKGVRVDRVRDAIRRAHDGESPVFENELDELIKRIDERELTSELTGRRLATLTPREIEVVRLIGAGLSMKEIAAELRISLSTVRTHTSSVLEKTGARTQLEAVAFARDQRLIY